MEKLTCEKTRAAYLLSDEIFGALRSVQLADRLLNSMLDFRMDDEEVEEYMNKTGVGTKEDQTVVEDPATTEEPETEEPGEKEPVKKGNPGMLVLVLVAGIGGIGGYFYITKAKKKKPVNNGVDPDADYNEDEEDYLDSIPEEDEPEEDPIPETDDEPEDEE